MAAAAAVHVASVNVLASLLAVAPTAGVVAATAHAPAPGAADAPHAIGTCHDHGLAEVADCPGSAAGTMPSPVAIARYACPPSPRCVDSRRQVEHVHVPEQAPDHSVLAGLDSMRRNHVPTRHRTGPSATLALVVDQRQRPVAAHVHTGT